MTGTRWNEWRYLVVDVEGNGAHPPDLVELAAVSITGGVIGEPRSWLVRPTSPITWQARKVHGITNDDVADQPSFDAVRDTVARLLADEVIIVGHNVHIDLDVLGRKLPGWHAYAVLDTLRVARALLPGLPSRTLGALVNYFDLANGLPEGLRPHRATYDALVTAKLLLALAVGKDGLPRSASELHELGGVSTAEPKTESQPGLF